MEQKSLKKNSILSLLRTIVGLLFPIITFPYASRILGVEKIGQVNFANTFVNYYVLIAGLGISNYAIREGAKIRDDKKEINQFCLEIVIINLISTVLSYLLLMISLRYSGLVEYKELILLFSVTILFNVLGINWLFNIYEEFAYITVRTIIMQIFSLIILFLFVRTKDDYLNYAVILVISNVGANIFNIKYSRKFISLKSYKPINLKKHMKPIIIIFGMSIASTIYLNLDITMLGFMSGDYEVGIYTAATKLNKLVANLIASVLVVFLPRLAHYIKLGNKEQFDDLVDKALNYILILTIPASIGLLILSREIILLFSGEAFISAVPTMLIKSPNIIFSVLNGFIAIQLFMPLNKELISLYATIAGAVLNVLLNYLLIPHYGASGAAVATLMAEVVVFIICMYTLRNIYRMDRLKKEIAKYLIAGILMIPAGILIKCFKANNILTVILITVAGGIIYGLTLYIMKAEICIQFRQFVIQKIKK